MKTIPLILTLCALTINVAIANESQPRFESVAMRLREESFHLDQLTIKRLEEKVSNLSRELKTKNDIPVVEVSEKSFLFYLAWLVILVQTSILLYWYLVFRSPVKLNLAERNNIRLQIENKELSKNIAAGLAPVLKAKKEYQDLIDKEPYEASIFEFRQRGRVKELKDQEARLLKIQNDQEVAQEYINKAEARNLALSNAHIRLIQVGQILGKFDSASLGDLADGLVKALQITKAITP